MINVTSEEFAESVRHAFGRDEEERLEAGPRVLCADDDESIRVLCASVLTRAGYSVDLVADGREALEKIERNDYAAILLDLSMPLIHGSTVLSVLTKRKPYLLARIALITAAPEAAIDPIYRLVASVLRKPLTLDAILRIVRRCCASQVVAALEVSDSTVSVR